MTKMSRGAGGEHCGAATGCVVTKIVANFGPGPTPESGDSVWGAISMDVEAPSVRRGSRLSALQAELSCGAFVCGGAGPWRVEECEKCQVTARPVTVVWLSFGG